ncbi:hypothetical protein F0562_019206 [Nyssa sinensis]|uniref:Glycosyl transferase CAP10 domain-containing protein n=1 Tax=Nyssa sinensis TaxID=561372 RepID=A0A5J4ZFM9_9ASTE|nr:hypothetical protein F0562_019206 [Nyssa sinensis]
MHGFRRQFTGELWQSSKKKTVKTTLLCIFLFLFIGTLVFGRWIDASIFSGYLSQKSILTSKQTLKKHEFPLDCTAWNQTQTCTKNYPTTNKPINPDRSSNQTCPDYFRWIHEDLRHWKETGITKEMVERARRTAHFRLVILNGKLLRWYPGRLPNLEMMFDCDDRPTIQSKDFRRPNSGPPPLFRYCSDGWSLDIVFPDWSFWGWAETNIRPWRNVLKDIKEGNKRIKWEERVPLAYWRGNPHVAPARADLMKCNVTAKDDWNTLLYVQDWNKESKQGYKESNLEDQCTHRYKIYIEGWAWSVSEKYILACNSPTLLITPRFYDFFIRGMAPLHHYWPIRDNDKCKSLKFAVEWGNNHSAKAQAIGEAASSYIQEDLQMDYVYDYMFHLLNEYAKLLKFKPAIPSKAVELCPERMACGEEGNWKKFMVESLVESPTDTIPCTLAPPYDPPALKDFLDEKFKSTKQVEMWENEYWDKVNSKKP